MEKKSYSEAKNLGWNWIVSGGSQLACDETNRMPSWALSRKPEKDITRGAKFNKKECVAFNSDIKGHVPGYTGYVRGSQRITGMTFGNKTKLACSTNLDDLVTQTGIPPKVTGMIRPDLSPKATVASKNEAAHKRIPGYMGFVPDTRDKFGDTYGRTTSKAFEKAYEFDGYRSHKNQEMKRREAAAGLSRDDEGAFSTNSMTLTRAR